MSTVAATAAAATTQSALTHAHYKEHEAHHDPGQKKDGPSLIEKLRERADKQLQEQEQKLAKLKEADLDKEKKKRKSIRNRFKLRKDSKEA